MPSKSKLYLISLNKFLWFIDIISYNKRAVSITALTYIHEQYGPIVNMREYLNLIKNIKEISNLSHKELGWKILKDLKKSLLNIPTILIY